MSKELTVLIGGHIETIVQAEQIIEAIVETSLMDGTRQDNDYIDDPAVVQTIMRSAVEGKTHIELYDNDSDRGLSDIEDIPINAPSIQLTWISKYHESETAYATTVKCVDGAIRYTGTHMDGVHVMLTSKEIIEAIEKGDEHPVDAIDALNDLIALANDAAGETIPPLTASPEVSAWLKIFGEKAA